MDKLRSEEVRLRNKLQEAEKRITLLELDLKQSNEKYRNLFENLGEEVHQWELIRNKEGEIQTWKLVDANSTALKSWKTTKEDVVGKQTNEIFGSDITALFIDMVKDVFDSNNATTWVEYFKPSNQYLQMITIPMGEHFISIGRDISEEKRAEKELVDSREEVLDSLKEAQLQLIKSEKMAALGVLTAGVAHEINNPLNFIAGGHAAIEQHLAETDNIDKKELREYLQWIKSGTDRASEIINSLNLFSRGGDHFDEDCDLQTIIKDCILILQHKHKSRIKINLTMPNDACTVKGNTGRLHQAVFNILSNAVDAIANQGEININLTDLEEEIELIIEDNGIGIDPTHLEQIVEPFFTTKPPGKGTGLGLSITNSIINEHHGRMIFTSHTNQGTAFKISLPKSPSL